MTGREKIINYAVERKVFRSSDMERELGLSRMHISRLIQEGRLERVGYGIPFKLPLAWAVERQVWHDV